MALEQFPVAIAADDRGVLIFHTWKNKVPEGIQVLPACAGASPDTPTPATTEGTVLLSETLKNARLGFDSFLERCSIMTVNVREHGASGHCQVYVNFESWEKWEAEHPGKEREECWYEQGNPYQVLLRDLFNKVYKGVKVKREGTKVSVSFSDKWLPDRAGERKIVFTKMTVAQEPSLLVATILVEAATILQEELATEVGTPASPEVAERGPVPASAEALAALARTFAKTR